MRKILKNGLVINPVSGEIILRDLYIENGRVCAEFTGGADEIIDCAGLYVAPGLVDIHVHFRDPGFTHKETLETGAQAALAGGYTTVVCMANTKPVIDTPELLAKQIDDSNLSIVNCRHAACATIGQKGAELTDFAALKSAGAAVISDDGQAITDAVIMLAALGAARDNDIVISTHSEDPRIPGRPPLAEDYMIARDLAFAEFTGAKLHIQHVTTASAVALIRSAKARGVDVTAETCPHYLQLTIDNGQLTIYKVFPPLRSAFDVEAVILGVVDGTIDIIATDHAPHSAAEKALPYAEAPGGMEGLETALAVCLTTLYHTGRLTLPDLMRKMSLNPALRLNLPRGGVCIGDIADIVIFNADEPWVPAAVDLKSKSRNNPFLGKELRGRVKRTLVAGV
ncbi:MAG: dihydroorotase [Oscillospiraceae bacterium]|jgi:dihydroorotase|nr:dihydroorotase [Oscillospiraceae bacterium]